MSRRRWVAALAATTVVAGALMVLVHPLVGGALLFAGIIPSATLIYWHLLVRGETPVVLLSLFDGQSSTGRATAESHLAALERSLLDDENVTASGPVTIRRIPVPISTASANRLLRLPQVVMVVRGTGDASTEISHWDTEVCFRHEGADVDLTLFALSVYNDDGRSSWLRGGRRGVAPATSSSVREGDLAVASLFAATLAVKHFRDIAKILLILLGEAFVNTTEIREPRTLRLPAPTDSALTSGLQGRVLLLEAVAKQRLRDPRTTLIDLEQQALAEDLGDESLAIWITATWFAGESERWSTTAETLSACSRWSDRYPESSTLAFNYGGVAIRARNPDLAKRQIGRAKRLAARETAVAQLQGNLAWSEDQPREALKHYRRARRGHASRLAWQIGDCHAALGRRRRALRAYRQALRRDSFRVPATAHARQVARWMQLLPTFPGGWRGSLWSLLHRHPRMARPLLRIWRFARPEDPYLGTWLARHALIVGDIRRADDWGTYATRLPETNRLIGHLDQAIVLALINDPDADDLASFLSAHARWLSDHGIPNVQEDLRTALIEFLDAAAASWSAEQLAPAVRLLYAHGISA
jgi:tetratricopeptide (TPR) repeat protein